jgi:hypothetical protein
MVAAEQQAAAQSPTPASSAKAASQAYSSILSEGWNTIPAEASRLESGLVGDPHNVAARTRLISYYYYYYQQMMAEPRARHIFWLIENHPEAQIFQVASDVTSMSPSWAKLNSDSDWNRARALWLRQIERFPNNTLVLSNAAQTLPIEDSIQADGSVEGSGTRQTRVDCEPGYGVRAGGTGCLLCPRPKGRAKSVHRLDKVPPHACDATDSSDSGSRRTDGT